MRRLLLLSVVALLPGTAGTLPRLSLSQLLEVSSAVVHGRVVRHWSAWDANHDLIWTHYELRPSEVLHGRTAPVFTISEPGGVVGDIGLKVSNSVAFTDGEEVVVFLRTTPVGFLRVSGGLQGKLRVTNTFAGKRVQGELQILRPTDMETLKSRIRAAAVRGEAK